MSEEWFTPVEEVVNRFRAGEMVIICDADDRENEGDLAVSVDLMTREQMTFMMQKARGLICVSVSPAIAERLELPLQVAANNSAFRTPFAPTIRLKSQGEQHASAAARLETLKRMIAFDVRPEEFISPGSVYPLITNPAGVVGRDGQTEGSYDLARLAGLTSAAVICEILEDDGTMCRGERLREYAEEHNLATTSVQEILEYRRTSAILLRKQYQGPRQTGLGDFDVHLYLDDITQKEHLALVYGELDTSKPVLTRIHSECLTGDIFGSERCDCGPQLEEAIRMIREEGSGVLLYLRQEGRGIGLSNKLKAYELQDQGHDTVEANLQLGFEPDERDFRVAGRIYQDLQISSIRLLTNNPQKVEAMNQCDINVAERLSLIIPTSEYSEGYLQVKKEKLGHLL